MTPAQLKKLYRQSLITGFVDFKKQRYSTAELEQIAKRRNISLTTAEPLFIQSAEIE